MSETIWRCFLRNVEQNINKRGSQSCCCWYQFMCALRLIDCELWVICQRIKSIRWVYRNSCTGMTPRISCFFNMEILQLILCFSSPASTYLRFQRCCKLGKSVDPLRVLCNLVVCSSCSPLFFIIKYIVRLQIHVLGQNNRFTNGWCCFRGRHTQLDHGCATVLGAGYIYPRCRDGNLQRAMCMSGEIRSVRVFSKALEYHSNIWELNERLLLNLESLYTQCTLCRIATWLSKSASEHVRQWTCAEHMGENFARISQKIGK